MTRKQKKKTWLWQVTRFGYGPVHSEKNTNNSIKINIQTNKQNCDNNDVSILLRPLPK